VATVVAVDFGASSIRVCRVDLAVRPPAIEVVHRYHHGPVTDGAGHLRWDWARLVSEMERGLGEAVEAGPVASIGVDTWGVDYGLIDAGGDLVAPPFSYRDHRTDGYRAVVDRVGEESLYAIAGVQLLPLNTIFRLAVHDRDELGRARRLLMLPELLVHHLTGEVTAERTSAGTTGLVDIGTGDWSPALLDVVGVARDLMPSIRAAGHRAGEWRGVPVHLVGGHDTASAVVAMGPAAGPRSAFVSAGTWVLVGREQPAPDVSDAARLANFTNEIGALGGVRFLKNLAGWWLIEGCRRAWGDPPVATLLEDAASLGTPWPVAGPLLDVGDPRYLNPPDMVTEVTAGLGLERESPPALVAAGIVESLAVGTARVVDELVSIDELAPIAEVVVFGGGSRSELYRQAVARHAGLPVVTGPVEATALGNALVQGIALGIYADLADARSCLAAAGAAT
jgi:rhamnulokinase